MMLRKEDKSIVDSFFSGVTLDELKDMLIIQPLSHRTTCPSCSHQMSNDWANLTNQCPRCKAEIYPTENTKVINTEIGPVKLELYDGYWRIDHKEINDYGIRTGYEFEGVSYRIFETIGEARDFIEEAVRDILKYDMDDEKTCDNCFDIFIACDRDVCPYCGSGNWWYTKDSLEEDEDEN